MAREQDVYSMSVTLLMVGTGSSTFVALNPIPNQVGVQFFLKTGGTLEIAGGGISSAGFGTSYSVINTGNKSVTGAVNPTLVANGMGFPFSAAASWTNNVNITFWGQPTIWFSAGGATCTVGVVYLKNSQDGA